MTQWRFGFMIFEPLLWYWTQLRWCAGQESPCSWAELAIDFQCVTHLQLCQPDEDDTQQTLNSRTKFFADASRRLAFMCKTQLCDAEMRRCNRSLCFLGLPPTSGYMRRPALLCKEGVNHVLLTAAIRAEQTLSFIPEFCARGPPLWTRGVGVDELPTLPAERKAKPSPTLAMVRPGIEWTEDELQLFTTLSVAKRNREQKVIIHNRVAEQRGMHVLESMYGADGVGDKLKCKICKNEANVKSLSNWPLKQCGGNGDLVAEGQIRRPSTMLAQRVDTITKHNDVKGKDGHHLVDIPTNVEASVCCSRPSCDATGTWRRIGRFLSQCCGNN